MIGWLNSRPNLTGYRALSRSCADFVRDIVNFYYPKAVSRSIVADLCITTPKRVAKSIAKYSRRHSYLEFVSLVILPAHRRLTAHKSDTVSPVH